MEELLDWMEYIEDIRQTSKVRHKLKDILVIVLFATLANADDWVEMEMFAQANESYLKKYIELKNGIPSHDTLNRVMGMIYAKATSQKLCLHKFMTTAREREKNAKRVSHRFA